MTVIAAGVPAAQASYPGADSRIAPGDDRSGAFEICTMDVSGQHLRQLTANGAVNACPAWSPDRTKLRFCSDISGTFQSGSRCTCDETSALVVDVDDVAVEPRQQVGMSELHDPRTAAVELVFRKHPRVLPRGLRV